MKTFIKNKRSISKKDSLIILSNKNNYLSTYNLSETEKKYIRKKEIKKEEIIEINQFERKLFIVNPKKIINQNLHAENCRLIGDQLIDKIKNLKHITIINEKKNQSELIQIVEGMALSNYQFTKHKTKSNKHLLDTIYIYKYNENQQLNELQNIINAVYFTRDMINEPFSHLNAKQLANEAIKSGEKYNYKVTVFNKKKIENLKMGGLLAVNKGSIDEPTFTIMHWKPKNAINKQPIIFVGKGVVYDTGGLSLKPTANSMDLMKIDMGGAGTVIGAMQAIAANKLPYYVIGLIPATDNRPSGNSYAPGDVITMHDGSSVEVMNTDAEGRLILADALSFAKKYNPKLVITLATLTGAAVAAIGHYGFVSMHQGAKQEHKKLKKIGDNVHERLAELPFWNDYDELIKSDIADIKNLGGPNAGAITAGKFLAYFTSYPFIHIDLPGVYSKTKFGYRGKGATGMGVRLLYEFIKSKI